MVRKIKKEIEVEICEICFTELNNKTTEITRDINDFESVTYKFHKQCAEDKLVNIAMGNQEVEIVNNKK